MVKEKVYSMKIKDIKTLRERITSQRADDNPELFH